MGRWTVIERRGYRSAHIEWLCLCECGTRRTVSGGNLRSGASQSCGCLNREVVSAMRTTHGERARGDRREAHKTAEYSAWLGMKRRCAATAGKDFRDYASRGIMVCEEWRHDFAAFLRELGRRPSNRHSVDRINTNGNYEPGNCRWATSSEQARNRRSNHIITSNGDTRLAIEWSESTGLLLTTITSRVQRGWSGHDAVTTPLMTSRSHRADSAAVMPKRRATDRTRAA